MPQRSSTGNDFGGTIAIKSICGTGVDNLDWEWTTPGDPPAGDLTHQIVGPINAETALFPSGGGILIAGTPSADAASLCWIVAETAADGTTADLVNVAVATIQLLGPNVSPFVCTLGLPCSVTVTGVGLPGTAVVALVSGLVERLDIEPYSDFSAK